jgi:DNA polymerase III delta prime subunit
MVQHLNRYLSITSHTSHTSSSSSIDKELFGSIFQGKQFPSDPRKLGFAPFEGTEIPLNQRQLQVVAEADQRLALVQGPPGTGKSTTIVAFIKERILPTSK